MRLVEADHWTLMFWRGLISGLCLFALSSLFSEKNLGELLVDLRGNGLFCGLLFAGANVCFVLSITHTAVANTLVILASMPFIAALLAIILMRQSPPLRTWVAILFAMVGILIVFWGRLADGRIFGDASALFCALFMAATLITVSRNPNINSLTAIGVGSFLAALFGLFMGANPASASISDYVYLAIDGGIIVPIALGLITYGPKLISAPEVSLIMLLETVVGPLWVWLVLSERPPSQTFVGGVVVITAVVANAWLGLRSKRL